MPDAVPKPPPFEQEKERSETPKAPPLPDAPDTMPGHHVVGPLPFNELEYDYLKQKRVENAKSFDEDHDIAAGAKRSAAQQIDKDAEILRTDKRLAAVDEKTEARQAKKVEQAQVVGESVTKKPASPPLPDAPPKPAITKTDFPATEKQAPKETAAEQSAQGDKNAPAPQNDLSALTKKVDDIHALLEAMPRLISQFSRLG